MKARAYRPSLKLMTTIRCRFTPLPGRMGEAAACGRLLPDSPSDAWPYAKRGVGRVGALVMQHLMERALQRGDREVVLSAQTHAIGFYESSGFIAGE